MAPACPLHVINAPGAAGILIENGAGVGTAALELKDRASPVNRWWVASGISANDGKFTIYDAAAGARLVIDKAGNLGIGTTSPESKLHVEGTIEVDETIQADDDSGLRLATDEGTTRLYIKDDGKVGVGTTDPQSLLSVGGSGQSYASVFVESSLTNGVRSEISSSDGSAIVGIASSTADSQNYGGYFVAHAGQGRGVYGIAGNSGDYINFGGYFEAAGIHGQGVCGKAGGSSGIGVYGNAEGSRGRGVVAPWARPAG
jgi:hypothetical protein